MPVVCLCFEVHQPRRLRRYAIFDVDRVHDYEDREANLEILNRVADRCYLPANRILSGLVRRHAGRFSIAFSISGTLLDQLGNHRSDVLDSFQELARTGAVEFLCETDCHSLAFLFSRKEFRRQVNSHKKRIQALFGQTPRTFRNTELIYNNDLARTAEKMNFRTVLAEGADRLLAGRSCNAPYRPPGCGRLKLLLRNYRFSDDIAFRFNDREWPEHPLTAAKFAGRLHRVDAAEAVISLYMDYETFGEHHPRETGIFEFLEALPGEILKHPDFCFQTPSQAAAGFEPVATLDAPDFVSWADEDRGLTAWLGNAMQNDAIRTLYKMEPQVARRNDPELQDAWRMLQVSDHFYYMCTKWLADGDVHQHFNPYPSPYDAYINYMNILDDFSRQLSRKTGAGKG